MKPGKVGRETLDNLELINGALPSTYTVRTPSGGLHFYYDETSEVQHVFKLDGFGTDIDSTNYVLLAGCRITVGSHGSYTVHNSAPVAPAPSWFAHYLKPSNKPDAVDQDPAVELDAPENIKRAIHHLRHDAPPSIEGQHGERTLLMVAATLKDMGISEWQSVELLTEHYNVEGKCEPLWSLHEGDTADRLDVKVHNAWAYLKQNKPGVNTPEADFGNDVEAETWGDGFGVDANGVVRFTPTDPAVVEAQEAWRKGRAKRRRAAAQAVYDAAEAEAIARAKSSGWR